MGAAQFCFGAWPVSARTISSGRRDLPRPPANGVDLFETCQRAVRLVAPMLIRAMDADDVDKIHLIHTEAVNITCALHYDAERREAWLRGRTPEGYLRAQQNGENFLVAILEGAVVGFASWRAEELLALFVLPSRQRRGVAHSLFDECGRRANESNFAITKLNATLNAREFYEQLGFKVTGRGYEIKRGKRIYHYKMRKA